MSKPIAFEVAIVGAGPAGTCAALRLLQLGYKVAIIEQAAFPRPQIGESLSPGIWNIFQYLDAENLLARPEYLRDLPAHVIWDTPVEKRMDAEHRGPGIIVDRATLDSDLLALCVARGAVVFQPAKLEKCERVGEGYQVLLQTPNGKQSLHAHFLFDARGKKGIPKSSRIPTAPLSVALWTHVPGEGLPEATLIEALEDAWLWGSPLPNGTFRILAFSAPQALKVASISTRMDALLAQSNLFPLEEMERPKTQAYFTCPVQSYWHTNAWEDHYLHLGEAAFALDPLSSTGVEKAMRFSLQAVIAFHTLMQQQAKSLAQNFYTQKLLKAVATHTNWTQQFYAQAWPETSHFFWAERSQPYVNPSWKDSPQEKMLASFSNPSAPTNPSDNLTPLSIRKTLAELQGIPLQVSKALKYQQSPCVVGDVLEYKTTISHPQLAEPIGYLAEIEIAPLLHSLDEGMTLDQIVDRWAGDLGRARGTRMAVALWGMGIFEFGEGHL